MTPEPLSVEETRHLAELEQAATPAPWFPSPPSNAYAEQRHLAGDEYFDETEWTVSSSPEGAGWNTDGGYPGYGIVEADARLIAEARSKLARLLSMANRLIELESALAYCKAKRIDWQDADGVLRDARFLGWRSPLETTS